MGRREGAPFARMLQSHLVPVSGSVNSSTESAGGRPDRRRGDADVTSAVGITDATARFIRMARAVWEITGLFKLEPLLLLPKDITAKLNAAVIEALAGVED